jgi:hypothetical protein
MGKISQRKHFEALRALDAAHNSEIRDMEREHTREMDSLRKEEVANALKSMDGRLANTNEWRAALDDMVKKIMGALWLVGVLWVITVAGLGIYAALRR